MASNLIYKVSDKPSFGKLLSFALQQLLAIMAATIAVPMIVGNGMSTSAALFGAGVGTIIYLLFTKFESPVFLGSSFAFLGSMAAAFAGGVSMSLGYLGLIIGAVFAGLVYVVIALIVKFVGVNWIDKLMPAVVIGPTVAIIGLSLAGNAVGDLQTTNYVQTLDAAAYQQVEIDANDYTIDEDGAYVLTPEEGAKEVIIVDADVDITRTDKIPAEKVHPEISYSDGAYTTNPGSVYVAIVCGLITLAVTILCSVFGKKFARLIPFIIGIFAGYLAAVIFYLIGKATGNAALMIIDFSPFTNLVKDGVGVSTFFTVPDFTFLTAFKGFGELNGTYISTIAVAYIPVAFVVFAEHLADHKNISSIIETDLLKDPGLHLRQILQVVHDDDYVAPRD